MTTYGQLLFEQVWAQDGRTVAVRPHGGLPPLLPGGEPLPEEGKGRGGESGSDGNENSVVDPIEIRVPSRGVASAVSDAMKLERRRC